MTNIGIVLHHHRPEIYALVERALNWCKDCGVRVRMVNVDAELIGHPEFGVLENEFADGLDLCVSFGGDGTMLRATHLVVSHQVPLLGINAGDLGYLAEIDPDQLELALSRWRAGELLVEERMMIEVLNGKGESLGVALNEAVIERAESGHMVSLVASIGDRRFTTYKADGLIVASPTGSTAYSLSAGGPVVEPDFQALIVVPVAAHMMFNRPLILAPSTEVRLEVEGYRSAMVTLDGRSGAILEPGDEVVVRRADMKTRLLVTGSRDFHAVLKEKFGLTDR
ncbi:MAG: NAD(+)/NADH kinase [Acidimicrobiales bacterium]|nr:NAD(+)/NADH kinase [Acidimicrobiales bacterium]